MYVITTADEKYYMSHSLFGMTLTTKYENAQKFKLLRKAKKALENYQEFWPDIKIKKV